MNPKVNWFFDKEGKWKEAYAELRELALSTKITEDLKWGVPCYTINENNVVLIHGFKDYCALLFHKGALMKDTQKLLIQQTKNVQSARQLRFTSLEDIIAKKKIIITYIKEAIEIEKSGLKVELKKTEEFDMPEEFATLLNEMSELKTAFDKLTPGRQRGYLLYFSQAKQVKTREARIEKYLPKILEGKGLDD
jgi:uncharacterized protein YdeI (YjbR/CyaY-like superfamily)